MFFIGIEFAVDTATQLRMVYRQETRMTPVEHTRRYRERIRQQGERQVLLKLPIETIEALDRVRDERGERSRSDVLVSLIHRALEDESELKTP
jgi:hypothetical protein